MLGAILVIVVIVLVVFFLFSVLKNLVKALLYTLLLCLVVFGAMGIMVYTDIVNFRQQAADSKNLFLLEKDGALLAGIVLSTDHDDEKELSVMTVEPPQMEQYSRLYSEGKLSAIRGSEFFKVVVFNEKALSGYYADSDFTIHNYTLDQKAVSRIVTSDEPYVTFKAELTRANEVDADYLSELDDYFLQDRADEGSASNDFRATFFYAVVKDMLFESKVQGTVYLVKKYKEGSVMIEPGSFLFTMVKWMPTTFFSQVFESMKEKAKDVVRAAGAKAIEAGSGKVSGYINNTNV